MDGDAMMNDMEDKNTSVQESNDENAQGEAWHAPLQRPTLLAKWLAITLFVLLPFAGFYMGVVYTLYQSNSVQTQVTPSSQLNTAPFAPVVSTTKDRVIVYSTYTDEDRGMSLLYPKDWQLNTLDTREPVTFEGEVQSVPILEVEKDGMPDAPWITVWEGCQGVSSSEFELYGEVGKQVHTLYVCKEGYLIDGNVWVGTPTLEADKAVVQAIVDSFEVQTAETLISHEDEAPAELIQECPDEWIWNRMPGTFDESSVSVEEYPREYYVVDGERREMSTYDTDWVDEHCFIEPQEVW